MNVQERWLSGRKRPPAKWVRYFLPSRVRIPISPPLILLFCGFFNLTYPALQNVGTSLQPSLWCLPTHDALPYYVKWIKRCNKRLKEQDAIEIAKHLVFSCAHHGLDARLMVAIIKVESDFNPNCVSRKGAMGLGQLMPINVFEMGVRNPFDPFENLESTIRMVKGHIVYYLKKTNDMQKALPLALAAYNAGSGAVKRYAGIPPYKETENYVQKVTLLYKRLSGIQ